MNTPARRVALSSFALLALLVAAVPAPAQVSLSTPGVAYTQAFDTLANSGTAAVTWTDNTTIGGWYSTRTTYLVSSGTSTSGSLFSFGAASATDRALGSQGSNATGTIQYAVRLLNNTGSTITSLDVAFVGEQWRNGGNTTAHSLTVSYQVGATAIGAGTWTAVPALAFTGPIATSTAGALDGNAAANRVSISSTVAVSVAAGQEIWLRWDDLNDSGNDHGLSIDEFSVTPQGSGPVVPALSIDDVTVTEGNSGTVTAAFTVSLSSPAGAGGVTFDIATADNTATTADNDYTANSLSGQTIAEGSTGPYTFNVTVNGDTTVEPTETFFVNVSSVVGANVGDGQGLGTITNDDVPVAEIFAIQGSGAVSPFATQVVTTNDNVVTAVGSQGFFIQTPDARADADPDTSNGIYVYTGGLPTVTVGDVVDVTGTVVEYFNFTEFSPVTSVSIDSSDNPLPTVIELDATLPPTDPTAAWWTIGFERLEGMLVHVANGVTSGPNQRFTSDLSAEIHGVASASRPFREPGIEYPGLVGLPVWDGNPEVFEIDPDRLGAVADPDYVAAGSTYSATGVMAYEFSDWELWPSSVTFTPPPMPRPVRTRSAGEFTVGTYNLYLFDATASDYAARLQKHSAYIRTVLGAPDVIGVQECMSITELTALAARIQSDDATLTYTPYLVEGHDVGGIDVGFLVRDTVTVATVTQLGYSATLSLDGSPLHDRPPLLLEATYIGNGAPFAFTVMVNHTRSLNNIDDAVDGPRVRQKRLEQAQWIAQAIQDYQTASPLRPFVMVGDLNAFEISDGYVDVVGQMAGDFVPADNLLSGPDLVDPNLTKQVLAVPANDRYSYNFGGTAQVLDHALTTQATNTWVRGFAYGRGNTDAAVNLIYDASTSLRSSDHDGAVLFLMSDANADGVPDDLSPAVLAATKTAAGAFVPGGVVTYTIVLANTALTAQLDNPGDELTDVLPAPLVLVSASATAGTAVATVATNTVTWNGSVPPGGAVTVTITAAIPANAVTGSTISNQATISYDADGNGTNEAAGVSDDPATGAVGDATSISVTENVNGLAVVPALDAFGLGLLAALVALGGALLVGRRLS